MADSNWADQAEAILKRRRSVMKEFSKLSGEARGIAEKNAESSFKAELQALLPPRMQYITNTGTGTYLTNAC